MEIRSGRKHARGGYVHSRTRRQCLAEALDLGVQAKVIHHRDLLTEASKPSARGYKVAEKLIVEVRASQAAGTDPAPLWAAWLVKGATASKAAEPVSPWP